MEWRRHPLAVAGLAGAVLVAVLGVIVYWYRPTPLEALAALVVVGTAVAVEETLYGAKL